MKASNGDQLWNSFKSGDRDAFAKIYNAYIEDLLSYGYRVTSNRQLIKDSIQDVFLHLWLQRENLSATNSVKFYLFRALRNRIVRNIETQHEKPTATYDPPLENLLVDFPFEQSIMETETHEEQIKHLRDAIGKLPKRQQEVIQLRFNQNFSLEEISDLMQISNQSVRNLLHRSLSELRRFFQVTGWVIFLLLMLQ
ncbi:RNA polymerase sigma factor [Dyadobacter aurulentus]|uniref:RNA polymerase sigma factor n=1 Tax=Dyadobacter sp. UC 10 TaxID=2605428 RepID=UPI0011F1F016|nr:sigma-70 family RNA polymerase sigma factor [Dyadobacter sp. UC 10]KAA0992797.1 sigma-70 family RNA polymerase sigma factor [Dyadobacter sp. UC 10]